MELRFILVAFVLVLVAGFAVGCICRLRKGGSAKAMTIHREEGTRHATEALPAWDSPLWEKYQWQKLEYFHEASVWKGAEVWAALRHDEENIYVTFRGKDRFVVATHTEANSSVCKDTCGEFFFSPFSDTSAYFNIEVSLTGAALIQWHPSGEQKDSQFVKPEDIAQLQVRTSFQRVVEPELAAADWVIDYVVPVKMLEKYTGRKIGALSGQSWQGNLYHCADNSSHPRWLCWSPIGKALRFHQPPYFGQMNFQ